MTYRWSAVEPWHFGFEAWADLSSPLTSWVILARTRTLHLMVIQEGRVKHWNIWGRDGTWR